MCFLYPDRPAPPSSLPTLGLLGLVPAYTPAALAGTDATRRHEYSLLSSFSPRHPLAMVATATRPTAAVAPGDPNNEDQLTNHDDRNNVRVGLLSSAGLSQKPYSGKEVVMLLGEAGAAGVGESPPAGIFAGVAARNHAGFAVAKDGTAGKVYIDLEGSVAGVTFVHVSGVSRRATKCCKNGIICMCFQRLVAELTASN